VFHHLGHLRGCREERDRPGRVYRDICVQHNELFIGLNSARRKISSSNGSSTVLLCRHEGGAVQAQQDVQQVPGDHEAGHRKDVKQ
jgi:hypothetical protein